MTKQMFMDAMHLKDKGKKKGNFIIYTNIAEGLGINGVDYTKYWENYESNRAKQTTKVLDVNELYVVLEVNNEKDRYPLGQLTVVLPLENIVQILILK